MSIQNIFGHNYFISEPIFKIIVTTFGLQKLWHGHIFLVVFPQNEILKNTVSESWCTDSRSIFMTKYTSIDQYAPYSQVSPVKGSRHEHLHVPVSSVPPLLHFIPLHGAVKRNNNYPNFNSAKIKLFSY